MLDNLLKFNNDNSAGPVSDGRYSNLTARAIARMQSRKVASQFNHVQLATNRQSRIASCPDRKDSTSGANEPKDAKHSGEMKCLQDFRSSARLRRRASRTIPSQRSSGTGLEIAASKSMGDLRQGNRLDVRGMGDVGHETLDIRKIVDVLGMVLQDDWDIR